MRNVHFYARTEKTQLRGCAPHVNHNWRFVDMNGKRVSLSYRPGIHEWERFSANLLVEIVVESLQCRQPRPQFVNLACVERAQLLGLRVERVELRGGFSKDEMVNSSR
eukprot:6173843-Pleurochrysis_carterae.AAC.3